MIMSNLFESIQILSFCDSRAERFTEGSRLKICEF